MVESSWKRARKGAKSLLGVTASLVAIATTMMVIDGLKMKISIKIIYLGGWIGPRWLVGTEKWLKSKDKAE